MSGFVALRICSFLLLVTFSEAFLESLMGGAAKGTGTYNGYSSPKFTVIEDTESYELREYEATNWATTTAVGGVNTLFMRLFRYISGNNEAALNIPMTVPVAIKMEKGSGNYTMMFFLKDAQNPKPDDKDVVLIAYPAFKAYVGTYGGYTNDAKLQANLDLLENAVGDKADRSSYFSVGYDAPWKFWSRRNEVWLVAK